MLGGGQPSKSHVLYPNMTNDTSLESSCALLLESAKKFANLRKLNLLSQNQVFSKNVCKNLTSESGSKQRFSLLQAKAVIQAVCLRTQAVSIKARF